MRLDCHLRTKPEPGSGSGGVQSVCRSFDVHVFLHARTRQQLTITRSVCTATRRPYAPFLKALKCSDPAVHFSRFVYRMLSSSPLPRLVSLTLHGHSLDDARNLLAAVASYTQLTELIIRLPSLYCDTTVPPPSFERPSLPSLRKLTLLLPCHTEDGTLAALGLRSLSEMRQLTSLEQRLTNNQLDSEVEWAEEYTPRMRELCNVLPHVSELRELVLQAWACCHGAAADTCWQLFARALPTPALWHLTRMELIDLLLPEHSEDSNYLPACPGLWPVRPHLPAQPVTVQLGELCGHRLAVEPGVACSQHAARACHWLVCRPYTAHNL